MMKNFLNRSARRNTFLLFGFYVFLSFFLMNFNDAFILRGMRLLVLQLVAFTDSIEQRAEKLQNLSQENQQLRRQVFELSLTNQRLQDVLIENIRLRRLLQLQKESEYGYIAARVIGFGREATLHSLILNVGSEDSVRKNMPVVSHEGLVGKILKVEADESIAQILMDRNSLVSARLQKSREVGVIGWSGNLWLDLNYVAKDVVVQPGELVITSGLSRIYPPGLKIGVVGEVETNQYELFQKIIVKNSVNYNNLEEVFILLVPDTVRNSGGEID